jgi:hypothetical protein
MQVVSTALSDTIKKAIATYASLRVIAEWNHNRYSPLTVDNWGRPEATYAHDLDLFPISSIAEPRRPTKGLHKAKVNEGVISDGIGDAPGNVRSYISSPDSLYKYWTSPEQSDGATTLANCSPYVLYTNSVVANKIYICFENSWATPDAFTVQTTIDGTNWVTVATNPAIDSKGRVQLWRNSGNAWTTTKDLGNPLGTLRGIRVNVTSLNKTSAHLNLIELGLRLEQDLSAFAIDYTVENELSDPDTITPMGIVSSNVGSVTLSNIDGRFNTEGDATIADGTPHLYKGLIDENTKFTIEAGFKTTEFGGSGFEYVTLGTMFSENWGGDDEQVSVPLKDESKFLQEINPLPMLMENVTIGKAIWKILDSVGFNNYTYDKAADEGSVIPYFWTDPEQSVWDNIQALCRATQTAVYFDEFGVLKIKTRAAAFDTTKAVDWTLDGTVNGTKQPDIVELSVGDSFEANNVKITYTPTQLSEDELKRPISEIVWQAEDDVVLRASALHTDMNNTQLHMWIDPDDVAVWPYEGQINLRGELINYSGKGYRYYTNATTTVFKVIKSNDEKVKLDQELSDPNHAYRNYFTGYLLLTERGVDNTNAIAHDTTIQPWLTMGARYGLAGGAQALWNGGLIHRRDESILRMQAKSTATTAHWYTAQRGAEFDASNTYFGTRIKFPSTPKGTEQSAGLFFWGNNSYNVMYAVDITSTARMEVNGRRNVGDEVRVLKRNGSTVTQLGGRGYPHIIGFDQWIDVDVIISGTTISVSINGVRVLNATDASPLTSTGRCGLYVRGYTVADFEYFYAASNLAQHDSELDNQSYLDIIKGGYYSNQFYKDSVYQVRTAKRRRGKKTITYKQKYASRFFDEFGILVHEIRKLDVKFEKFPVIWSSPLITNDQQVVLDEYISTPFGARFIIANAARWNSIVNGQDTITYGDDNSVDQRLLITGRTIQRAEPKVYEVKNEAAIRARGVIPLEFESDWIQTEAAAKALGDWIVTNWAEPADSVEVEVHGNPLFQLGDLVSVNYALKDMTAATHKYFVIGVRQDWEDGPGTNLTLRRANI